MMLDKYSILTNLSKLPKPNSLVAIDCETNGEGIHTDEFRVVGIGLADDKHCVYINVSELEYEHKEALITRLTTYKLIAHNVMFDAAALARFIGSITSLQWSWCTYGLYKQIATEGYPGQRWGLKNAMLDLLGWEEPNNLELNQWLVDNGHVTGSIKRPNKSKLYLAPAKIVAEYCGLDAEACWQLYKLFDRQVLSDPRYEILSYYHQRIFIPNVMLLVEQQLRGMRINTDKLTKYKTRLENKIVELERQFKEHETTEHHIKEYEATKYKEYLNQTKNPRLDNTHKKFRFNINSKQQLEWLFYERLYSYYIIEDKRRQEKYAIINTNPELKVKLTPTDRIPMSKKVQPFLGEPGRLLITYNAAVKELGYVKACLDSCVDDILHAGFKAPGTVTGRLAGGLLND